MGVTFLINFKTTPSKIAIKEIKCDSNLIYLSEYGKKICCKHINLHHCGINMYFCNNDESYMCQKQVLCLRGQQCDNMPDWSGVRQ